MDTEANLHHNYMSKSSTLKIDAKYHLRSRDIMKGNPKNAFWEKYVFSKSFSKLNIFTDKKLFNNNFCDKSQNIKGKLYLGKQAYYKNPFFKFYST